MGYFADLKQRIRTINPDITQRNMAVAIAYLESGKSPAESVALAEGHRIERAAKQAERSRKYEDIEAAETDRLLGEDFTSEYDNNDEP